jgi:hypothetical protein
MPGLRGVGLAGSHVVYAVGGTIRSLDGAFDLPLLSRWRGVLALPRRAVLDALKESARL